MRTLITKMVSFDAAHRLPDHDGKCRNIHGHSYRVEITVSGPLREGGSSDGMVMDFADLGRRAERLVVEPLDHQFLNDVLDFVPTAERLAGWILEQLLADGLAVESVRLWETPTSYAEVRP